MVAIQWLMAAFSWGIGVAEHTLNMAGKNEVADADEVKARGTDTRKRP